MSPESRPLHRAASTGETTSPHIAEGIVERAREGHRTRLRDGFRRNPHLRGSGCLEAYIEADLLTAPRMLVRAICLSIRYPDLELSISMVAADYGLWNVRAWARRVRTAGFVLLSVLLSGVIVGAGLYKVEITERNAVRISEAQLEALNRSMAERLGVAYGRVPIRMSQEEFDSVGVEGGLKVGDEGEDSADR